MKRRMVVGWALFSAAVMLAVPGTARAAKSTGSADLPPHEEDYAAAPAREAQKRIVGWLDAVDAAAGKITVSQVKGQPPWSPDMIFSVDSGTTILVNGEELIIEELKAGAPVRVSYGFKDGNPYARSVVIDERPRRLNYNQGRI